MSLATISLPTLAPMPATVHQLGPDAAYEAHVRASMGIRGPSLFSDADDSVLPAILRPRLAGRAPDLPGAYSTGPVVAGD